MKIKEITEMEEKKDKQNIKPQFKPINSSSPSDIKHAQEAHPIRKKASTIADDKKIETILKMNASTIMMDMPAASLSETCVYLNNYAHRQSPPLPQASIPLTNVTIDEQNETEISLDEYMLPYSFARPVSGRSLPLSSNFSMGSTETVNCLGYIPHISYDANIGQSDQKEEEKAEEVFAVENDDEELIRLVSVQSAVNSYARESIDDILDEDICKSLMVF